jgi:hypothetical protein
MQENKTKGVALASLTSRRIAPTGFLLPAAHSELPQQLARKDHVSFQNL